MEIYLIRHTTPAIEKGVCYGQSDIALKNTFLQEASLVLGNLPKNITKVYSSPLKRCTHLAKLIDDNYSTDARLMEINFGLWELKKWDDIPWEESKLWMEDFVNVSVPNGESYIALQERVIDFYKEIIKNHESSKVIAIVTHAGVIRALLSYLRNIDLKDSFEIKVIYGQVFRVEV